MDFVAGAEALVDVIDHHVIGHGAPASHFATHGYRVIAVYDQSPAEGVFRPFFDVIVGRDGTAFNAKECTPHSGPLHAAIKASEGKKLKLDVYDNRTRAVRVVEIAPNRDWPNSNGLLGVLSRFDPVRSEDVILPV